MNRFDTSANGRMPFVLDDIRFQDETFRFAISLIMQSLASENCILSGCIPVGNQYNYTNGYAWINNELFQVNGYLLNSLPAKLQLVETALNSGEKVYGDGVTRQTHFWRRLHIINSYNAPVFADLPTKNFDQVLLKKFIGSPFSEGVVKNVANKFVTEAIKTAFNKDFGTTIGTVATGEHLHDDRYWQISETATLSMMQAIFVAEQTNQENFLLK